MVNLLLGDCLELLPTIADNSVDMLLVDLPYGTTACKWDSIIPLDKLWEQYNRICKENAAMVFTAAQPFTTILAASNIQNLKLLSTLYVIISTARQAPTKPATKIAQSENTG